MERTRDPNAAAAPTTSHPTRPMSPAQRRLAALQSPAGAPFPPDEQPLPGHQPTEEQPLPGIPLSEAISAHRTPPQRLWLTSFADLVPPTLRGRWLLDTRAAVALGCLALSGALVGGWYLWQSQPTVVELAGAAGPAGRAGDGQSGGGVEHAVSMASDNATPDGRQQTIIVPDVPESPGPDARSGTAAGDAAGPSGPVGAGGAIVVDVEGQVPHPGIQRLARGSRVYDALRAAGGAPSGLDLTALDLARPLTDGEQLRIGLAGVAASAPTDPSSAATGGHLKRGRPTSPVNLNTATITDLETIPDIGPAMAQRILDWRTQNGRFTSVGQLRQVRGIGDRKYADMKDSVTV